MNSIVRFTFCLAVVLSLSAILSHPAGAQNKTRYRDVKTEFDVPYAGTKNARQTLDLFLPKTRKSDKPLPVIAFIHGGAWRAGNKRRGHREVLPYVASGRFVGVSIAYRLTNEAIWPAQIHDCKAAIRWIKGNAKRLNIDPERIAVMGTSAGGHLVAMLGVSGDVKKLEGKLGKHTDQNSKVACVVDFFGPTELLTMNDHPSRIDHNATNSPESKLIGGAIQKNKTKAKEASPITHVSKGDAPFLIIHGSKDMLVPYPQSVAFNKALKQAGVSSVLIKIDGGGHGGFRSREVNTRVAAFLEQQLYGKKVKVPSTAIKQGRR